jgi:hypothetical protein
MTGLIRAMIRRRTAGAFLVAVAVRLGGCRESPPPLLQAMEPTVIEDDDPPR